MDIKDIVNLREKTSMICQQLTNVYPTDAFHYMLVNYTI